MIVARCTVNKLALKNMELILWTKGTLLSSGQHPGQEGKEEPLILMEAKEILPVNVSLCHCTI